MSSPSDPTIICPQCRAEVKLTDSLAAPLLDATRKQYEAMLSAKDAEVLKREKAIKEQQELLSKEKESIEKEISKKLKQARTLIAE